jgi:hypothetical protein
MLAERPARKKDGRPTIGRPSRCSRSNTQLLSVIERVGEHTVVLPAWHTFAV